MKGSIFSVYDSILPSTITGNSVTCVNIRSNLHFFDILRLHIYHPLLLGISVPCVTNRTCFDNIPENILYEIGQNVWSLFETSKLLSNIATNIEFFDYNYKYPFSKPITEDHLGHFDILELQGYHPL